jgi:hypothetical protein
MEVEPPMWSIRRWLQRRLARRLAIALRDALLPVS